MTRQYQTLFLTITLIILSAYSSSAHSSLHYYELINKAELAVCDAKLSEALTFYEEAFIINPRKPFTKDLLNAFHCAIDNNNTALAKKYIQRLLTRGMKQAVLNNDIYQYYNEPQRQMIRSLIAPMRNDTLKTNEFTAQIEAMLAAENAMAAISPRNSAACGFVSGNERASYPYADDFIFPLWSA